MNDALLARVVEAPDDDQARLDYADGIEARGDLERAEFIRLQIARAAADGAWTDREIHLLRQHRTRWEDALPELPDGMVWGLDYRRGLLDTLLCTNLDDLADLDPGVMEAQPITRLVLAEWRPNQRPIAARLARIRSLVLRRSTTTSGMGFADDARVEALLGEPWIGGVPSLELDNLALSMEAVARIADAELPGLRRLSWRRYGEPRAAVSRLLDARWLAQLTEFEIEHHPLDLDTVRRLGAALPRDLERLALVHVGLDAAACEALAVALPPRLRSLDLSRNRPGPEGVRALLAAASSGVRLRLRECGLGDEGWVAYAASPGLAVETELRPDPDDPMGDRGAAAVAASPHVGRVATLYLVAQRIGEAGARALLRSPRLRAVEVVNLERSPVGALAACEHPRLRVLCARAAGLTDPGIAEFVDASELPSLVSLTLSRNTLGPATARRIAHARGLPRLTDLDLSGNPLGTEGLRALCLGPRTTLRSLSLTSCGIDEGALAMLLESPLLAHLDRLRLADNPIPRDEYAALCARAAERGCAVDGWSPEVPLRTIERGGADLDPAARGELGRVLRRLRFTESGSIPWVKVCPLDELAEYASDRRDRRHLAAYAAGDRGEEALSSIFAMFAEHWLASELPESLATPSVWDLEPVGREDGRAALTRLLAGRDEELRGVRPIFVPRGEGRALTAREAKVVALPYAALQGWIEGLFAPEEAFWAASERSAVWISDARLFALVWWT
ncbi:MAG: TIGR02996 domain-containing protein [Nannocystaceae bacterium]